ncbi:MAG: ribonucleoside-diphosphate reductase [Planctomycetota bacterium]|nr:MAG: ribonucleoside-diphosphate reductase [Planctomycetota bacterium]
MSTPIGDTVPRYCDLNSQEYAWWSIRSRDEQFRTFDPERIARAIAKALAAADNNPELSPGRSTLCANITRDVCQALVTRKPEGGSFYIEEIQDQAELGLMRAGEHEAARRFVLYREERRRARHDPSALPGDQDDIHDLLDNIADPLLKEDMNRFVMFPIKHHDLWDTFKEHLALMWTAEEIDLSKDVQDWRKLNADEQHFIKHVLAFFAASDGIVNENLAIRFYNDVKSAEARAFYSMQMLIETIHSETYSLLIDTYINDEVEKNYLLQAAETMPIVKKKAEWALKWLGAESSFPERLLAFACVEGIFFSSSFCSIYWIKDHKQGLLPGLTFSNELISRDEGIHTDFAVMLHNELQEKLSRDRIVELVREAVVIEEEFATEALPVSLIGMNAEAMRTYIRFVADRLLSQLDCDPIYKVRCPFDFMERIALQNKTNFHEKKVAEYRRAGVGHNQHDQTIAFDADF